MADSNLRSIAPLLQVALFVLLFLAANAHAQSCPTKIDFTIGTYTGQPWLPAANGSGIVLASFSHRQLTETAILSRSLTGENPSYVARSSPFLYATNENGPEGALVEIRFRPRHPFFSSVFRSSGVAGTTHVAVVHSQRNGHRVIAVANYDGAITTFVKSRKTGLKRAQIYKIPVEFAAKLRNSSLSDRQTGPHPHMILPYRYKGLKMIVPDLGSDIVFVFSVNRWTGKIRQVSRAQLGDGVGPRHAAVHPLSKTVFVVNELLPSVSVLRPGCSNNAVLGVCYTVKLMKDGEGYEGASAAAIRVSGNGRFLYASIRNPDGRTGSIVGYRLDKHGDILRRIGVFSSGGVHPRDLFIVEDVKVGSACQSFVAVVNMDSNNLVLIRRNVVDGKLIASGGFSLRIDSPVSVFY